MFRFLIMHKIFTKFPLQDLVDDDVMVLDSGHEIYVWIGLHSTDKEREAGFKMAQVFIKFFNNLLILSKIIIYFAAVGISGH